MLFLIGQISICLIIAALLGAAIGWWLRGMRCRAREDDLTAGLEGQATALKSAEKKVIVLETSLYDLRTELDHTTIRLQKRVDELEPLIKTVADRENEISVMRSKVSMLPSLQEQVESANTECERLQNELQLVTDVKVGEISRLRKQVSEFERVRDDHGAEKKLFKTPAEKDDLKKISGIGQVLEQMLNTIGITTFQQIARFTEQDVKQVDDALQAFQGRIVRDNWIGGAQAEYQKKYGKSIYQ